MPIIRTEQLTKKFGTFTANHQISMQVDAGKIKAIVGENGAGKTTLMNMIYGLLTPTEGTLYIHDRKVMLNSPTDAIKLGIGMVHQHFKLVPSLTVFENVLLGIEITRSFTLAGKSFPLPFIDRRRARQSVQNIIDKYNFNIDANAKVRHLSVGAQQKVEIIKMLYRDVDIIIFDEPSAMLTPQEIDALFETMRFMKKNGKTIILITHKLQEVMDVSDSVLVIKNGRVVADMETANTNKAEIARHMVGRDVLLDVDKTYRDLQDKPLIYEVNDVSTKDTRNLEVVKRVSFALREGEILGVAGVEGNGQTELIHVLTGLMKATQGSVHFKQEDITNLWPKDLRRRGIGIIPEDRFAHGICKELSIRDNAIAGYHNAPNICNFGLFKYKNINKRRDDLIKKYDIRISDANDLVASLSGGNAQKIIIAREFDPDPALLIAAQPTRGVDIGAIEYIHKALLESTKKGRAVLLISNDLSEIMSLSDRIIVMYKGSITGEVDGKSATREQVGLLMAGITDTKGGEANA